jgi:hypothetical protein
LLRIDQTPFLSPEAGLNLNPGSHQSDEWDSQVDYLALVYVIKTHLLGLPGERLPPLGSTCPVAPGWGVPLGGLG